MVTYILDNRKQGEEVLEYRRAGISVQKIEASGALVLLCTAAGRE